MEQTKKKFITSFQSNLVSEGKELCKEVESLLDGNDEFTIKKAYSYSNFISYLIDDETKLRVRCEKYKTDFDNFYKCKAIFGNYVNLSEDKIHWK